MIASQYRSKDADVFITSTYPVMPTCFILTCTADKNSEQIPMLPEAIPCLDAMTEHLFLVSYVSEFQSLHTVRSGPSRTEFMCRARDLWESELCVQHHTGLYKCPVSGQRITTSSTNYPTDWVINKLMNKCIRNGLLHCHLQCFIINKLTN